MWIAALAAFGLIKASFAPEEAIQELRSLLRASKLLVPEQVQTPYRAVFIGIITILLISILTGFLGAQS